MRLALLCDDPAILSWLDVLANDSAHEVVLAATVSPETSARLRSLVGVKLTNQWEDLLIARDVDAILVGGSEPAVLEAIKQLASAGQSLLFVPTAAQGSTFIYELSLIRDDNRVKLFPAIVHRFDRALVKLRTQLLDGSLGKIQMLQFERQLHGVLTMSALSLAAVETAALPDLDLLRWLSGDYDQVTALRTGATSDALLTQTITLAGRGLPEATWNVMASKEDASCRLTVHAERGRLLLEHDAVAGEWVLTDPDGAQVEGDRRLAVRGLLDEFEASLSRDTTPIEWSELVKAFETLDATRRSVMRRRTIELHFEPLSERAIFKTQMTAIGCGVLIGTFLLTLAYLAVASTVPLPQSVLLILRTLVFAPLAVFLLLQILFPLARPSRSQSESESDASASP